MPALEDILTTDKDLLSWNGTTAVRRTPSDAVAGAVQTINAQTGTTYTLVVGDANHIVTLTNASPITLTVPANATAAIPVGSSVTLIQRGAGQVTIAEAGGVNVDFPDEFLSKIIGQHGVAVLFKLATNDWVLGGSLEAV
jgi:hypothetical protein